MISRWGSGGGAPLVKVINHFGGLSPQKEFLDWPCFSKFIDLASKAFSITMINYDCYVIIETFLIVDYTTSVLK